MSRNNQDQIVSADNESIDRLDSRSVGNVDWVHTLFPPTHTYSLAELLEELEARMDGRDPERCKRQSAFERLANSRVSPQDAEGIKNVYERVWFLMKLQEQRKGVKSESDYHALPVSDSGLRRPTSDAANQTEDDLDLYCSPDCIWTPRELKAFRSLYRRARTERGRLEAESTELKSRLVELDCRSKDTNRSLVESSAKFRETEKINTRLQILAANLKTEVERYRKKVVELEGRVENLGRERTEKGQEAEKFRREFNLMRLKTEDLQRGLEEQHVELLKEYEGREAVLRVRHEEEMRKVKESLEQKESEMEKEKIEHGRTRNALEHLRRHFSGVEPRKIVEKERGEDRVSPFVNVWEWNLEGGIAERDVLTKWTI